MLPYSEVEVLRPTNLHQALTLMAEAAETGDPLRPMAGCTDLMVEARDGRLSWHRFIDLWGLRFVLGELEWALAGAVDPGALTIGALATYSDLLSESRACEELPTLALASSQIGATQIQARGTFAGNVENASPAADAVPVLMAQGARVRLQSLRGIRDVRLDDYYVGYRQTVRADDELITAIVLPRQEIPARGHFFRKVGTRTFQAITKVGLAASLDWREGAIASAVVVAVAMAATTRRCPAVERALIGAKGLTRELKRALREAQQQDLTPIDDIRSTARYRAEIFHRLVCQAVRDTKSDP